jgi:serine/threonine protein kinase
MPAHAAAQLLHGVVSAVAHMHARGIVHRDIKAENLMLLRPLANGRDAAPTIKLIDFGFSTVNYNRMVQHGKS